MVQPLTPLADVLARAALRTDRGERISGQPTPTGFSPLDDHLSGGLRPGELVLLGGPQGLGKTTFALQVARNAAAAGASAAYFSYEHDELGILQRLLVLEAYTSVGPAADTLSSMRARMEKAGGQARSIGDVLSDAAGAVSAADVLAGYGDRLTVHASSGRSTSVEVIRDQVLQAVAEGHRPLVVVDYLQKVHVPSALGEDERVTLVVEGLKDLALEAHVAVVAIAAATQEGIAPGHRLRLHELRGSSALAYEADVILLLNEKYDVVARHHLLYDPRSAERFRQVAVCSIEKNRSGRAGIDLEFRKEFEFCRYDPVGNVVVEDTVDERVVAQ